jgi:glutamate N-acetyltransferase/amino-acid N-acetyltransferase
MSNPAEWDLADGYRFAGVHCGIRPDPDRLDLALIVSDRPASAAGVFTRNRVCAAPVQVSRERLPADEVRGVVICSGNANACTGAQGLRDARRMAAVAAEAVGCKPRQMLVCSTGVIGRPLPMSCIEPGIRAAAKKLQAGSQALGDAAHAILTTDTRIKVHSRESRGVRVTGLAKGAAMIGPNMATMLAFVLTDTAVKASDLARIARATVKQSFNCISVDGHTSTNDTVLFLANGSARPLPARSVAPEFQAICNSLARDIVADAEGASHLIRIRVEGLRNDSDALKVAKVVADSPLVKTAIFGGDPNWGRIVSAAGYAGVDFEEKHLSVWIGDFLVYRAGTPHPFDAAVVSGYLKENREVEIRLRFRLGKGSCNFWTSDLTYEYVKLNAEYTT